MSWDIWLVADLGAGEQVVCDNDHNYTHNTNDMIRKAGDGSSPYEWEGIEAGKLGALLGGIVDAMNADPSAYDAMNPSNGWGKRETLVAALSKLKADCDSYPKATVRTCC